VIEIWPQTLLTGDPAVDAIFEGRIYADQAPDAPKYPFATIHRAGGAPEAVLKGPINKDSPRIQIDVLDNRGKARLLEAKQVIRDLLHCFHGAVDSSGECVIDCCLCISDFDLAEVSTERAGPRVKRRVLEFSIKSKERSDA